MGNVTFGMTSFHQAVEALIFCDRKEVQALRYPANKLSTVILECEWLSSLSILCMLTVLQVWCVDNEST